MSSLEQFEAWWEANQEERVLAPCMREDFLAAWEASRAALDLPEALPVPEMLYEPSRKYAEGWNDCLEAFKEE